MDGSGNVYIADGGNNRVLKLAPSGGDFGTVNVGSTSTAITLAFTFDTCGPPGSTAVLTQGAAGLDFADAPMPAREAAGTERVDYAGDTCTIDVTFTPKLRRNPLWRGGSLRWLGEM